MEERSEWLMNGLLDKKVKQQVEFVKNPNNIDDVLDEVVKYREARQVNSKDVGGRRHPQRVARTSPVSQMRMDQVMTLKSTPGWQGVLESDLQREPTIRARINRANPLPDLGDNRGLSFTMEDVKSLVATETQKCLNSIQDILSKSSNGSSNKGQWGQGQGYHSQRGRRQPRGGRGG